MVDFLLLAMACFTAMVLIVGFLEGMSHGG